MKYLFIVFILMGLFKRTNAQSNEVQQLLLNVEKLTQLKSMLSDMKKGYQIVSNGYQSIKNISEGNFNLHEIFINKLMAVNPVIKNYKRVADIIAYEKDLVKESKSAVSKFTKRDIFNPNEVIYIKQVYSDLLKQSLKNLNDLTIVITASDLSMNDDERLKIIDGIADDTEDKLQFLRNFNSDVNVFLIQRSREIEDVKQSKNLYQLNN